MREKKWIAAVLALCMLCSQLPALGVYAEETVMASGTCGVGLTWTLTQSGVMTISGTGAMTDYGSIWDTPWSAYKSSIKSVVIENGVTEIGSATFNSCDNLTRVSVANSITRIGAAAFGYCYNLTDVTLGSGLTEIEDNGFTDCYGLTNVCVPDGVTTLGAGAFAWCFALSVITVPQSVTYIGEGAFHDCGQLWHVLYQGTKAQWDSVYFDGSNSALQQATRHYSCTGDEIESVSVAPTCTDRGYTSYTCHICKETCQTSYMDPLGHTYEAGKDSCVVCGQNKVTMGRCGDGASYVYNDETGDLVISGTGDLRRDASLLWPNATTVAIADGITGLSDGAFRNCWNLTGVVIPDSVTYIGSEAFFNCYSMDSVTIGNGVQSIGDAAFENCVSLKTIAIPDSVADVGEGLLRACYGLESVILGKGLTSLGDAMFYDCFNLTAVTIPEGVADIGEQAFAWCQSLTEITFLGDAPSIAADAFLAVMAMAHYPGNNATWTGELLEGYGGELVWKAYEQEAPGTASGDVNGDGKIDTTDAKLIMQFDLGLIGEDAVNLAAADVNGDGKIDTTDAKLIMQLDLGLITEFPKP